jgi:hypothetical protein
MKYTHAILTLLSGGAVYVAVAALVGGPALRSVSDPVPAARAETSGSRLKAKYVTGSDGSKIYVPEIAFDSQLGVDCAFVTAADGKVRCIPNVAPDSIDGWGATGYTDAVCTKPAVWINAAPVGCPQQVPKYVWINEYPGPYCPVADPAKALRFVHQVGALVGGASKYTKDGAGACKFSSGPSASTVAYELTEVPASTFVEGSAGIDP